ncbi:J domain-containing protein [Ferrimonas lipolytica]|uniref:J domain-containing protein n=1 Tax=Ferrimonas lipolytica TaxID=2724191 RepID=A0A6H1UFK3_9GAMM|nr:J domain-containing protein [Ferrimonas lipolytica]QIZ77103.1 J domain-containing protein [Ferrimonas lipolytica]
MLSVIIIIALVTLIIAELALRHARLALTSKPRPRYVTKKSQRAQRLKPTASSDKNPLFRSLVSRTESDSVYSPRQHLKTVIEVDKQRRSLQILGFKQMPTKVQLKQRMRLLAKRYHPDLGGDIRTMQRINKAYQLLVK